MKVEIQPRFYLVGLTMPIYLLIIFVLPNLSRGGCHGYRFTQTGVANEGDRVIGAVLSIAETAAHYGAMEKALDSSQLID